MTRTEIVMLLAAVGLGAAAVWCWRRMQPSKPNIVRQPSETSAKDGAPLSDPSALAVGTTSTDGKWYVTTTRQGTKHWEGGTNPYTTPEAIAFANQLFAPVATSRQDVPGTATNPFGTQ